MADEATSFRTVTNLLYARKNPISGNESAIFTSTPFEQAVFKASMSYRPIPIAATVWYWGKRKGSGRMQIMVLAILETVRLKPDKNTNPL